MTSNEKNNSLYNLSCETVEGKHLKLNQYRNRVVLIVNTASRCHFRNQLSDLQELYERFHDYGLEILAFPCNQFLHQESLNVHQINKTYSKKYCVDFQIFRKVRVNGKFAHPVFDFLKERAPGAYGTKGIKWNFTKFLVDHNGEEIMRFSPASSVDSMLNDVVRMLESRMDSSQQEKFAAGTPLSKLSFKVKGKPKTKFSIGRSAR